LQNEIKIF